MNSQPGNQTDDIEGYPSVERPPFVPPEPTINDYYKLVAETLSEKAKDAFYSAMGVVEKVGANLNAVVDVNYYIEKSATNTLSLLPALEGLGAAGDRCCEAARELLFNIQDAAVSPQEYAAREVKLLGTTNALKEIIETAIGEIEKDDPIKGAKLVEILNELKESVENIHAALEEVVHQLVPERPPERDN